MLSNSSADKSLFKSIGTFVSSPSSVHCSVSVGFSSLVSVAYAFLQLKNITTKKHKLNNNAFDINFLKLFLNINYYKIMPN